MLKKSLFTVMLVIVMIMLAGVFSACPENQSVMQKLLATSETGTLSGNEIPFYLQGMWTPTNIRIGDVVGPAEPGRYTSYLLTPNQITMFRQATTSADINDTYRTDFRYIYNEKNNAQVMALYANLANALRTMPTSFWDDSISPGIGTIWLSIVGPSGAALTDIQVWNSAKALFPQVDAALSSTPANSSAVAIYNSVRSAYNTFAIGVFGGVLFDEYLIGAITYPYSGTPSSGKPLQAMAKIIDSISPTAQTVMAGRMSLINLTNNEEDVVIDFVYQAPDSFGGHTKFITNVDIKNRDLYWQNWKAIPYIGLHFK